MPTIAKVWIEEDCITCDACQDILPEVFTVTDDTSFISAHIREDGNFDQNTGRSAIKKEFRAEYSDIIEERTAPTDADLASDQTLDDWLLRTVSSSFHISGTCKMGDASDRESVVDQHLKVRGIENLRIVDASVMPDVVRANTNVTTMMIAERAADFIKQGL